MILLRANAELHQTFKKLIQTAKIPVKWNGVFAVVDNYIILQGEVRSLFFHFDSKKVTTNIIEIPENVQIQEVGENLRVQNTINMVLYAFGKWGTIKGIRVEKDYPQLNKLFVSLMRDYDVEPEYTPQYMRFYRNGMRATYEEVIQMALEYSEEEKHEAEVRGQGLWHKIIWTSAHENFIRVDTTIEERRASRIGNNFYMVGYLCPVCGKNLHMVVYPEGKEFNIETDEGAVLLARAATCRHCQCFYTPRPYKLLAEGDIYVMEFGEDTAAYEDYIELLGRDGDRISNYHCNRYADGRGVLQEEAEQLEEIYTSLPELSEKELHKIEARMEEGFYPEESIRKYENAVRKQAKSRKRQFAKTGFEADTESGTGVFARTKEASKKAGKVYASEKSAAPEENISGKSRRLAGREDAKKHTAVQKEEGTDRTKRAAYEEEALVSLPEYEEVRRKYDARLNVIERYSDRQLHELKKQLEHEKKLLPHEREEYLSRVEYKLAEEKAARLSEKAASCEGKNYVTIKRVMEEVEQAQIPQDRKAPLLEKLQDFKRVQAKREADQLIAKLPKQLDREQYKQYVQRVRDYEEVDMTPYEAELRQRREAAEKQELLNVVKRARKVSREDFTELKDKLQKGDFLPELVVPYVEKIDARIREFDADTIAHICPNPMQMSFEEGLEAYEQIEQGDFLPELKQDALKNLSKRLSKIKTEESELLVHKLKEALEEAGIVDVPKHHFYPARKVLLKQAMPKEVNVIEYALASYAAGKGRFEYPILVVDATRSGTGKEGIIITPDHLYYSTLLSAYGVLIDTIARIEASTGLLNRGLYMYQKNGTKTKLPYAVENKDLAAFAEVLDTFVHYLQEKPDSRSLTYLASEKHENICCFRCGFEYKGGSVCPKCGYQNNE